MLPDITIYKARFDEYLLLSESAQLVLATFKEYPEIRQSTKQLIELTKMPRRTVTHCLSTLTNKGFIPRKGQGAGVKYQLIF